MNATQQTDTDRYAVIGNPIAHSKSPIIHGIFAKSTAQVMTYETVLSPLDGFELTVNNLILQGFKGVNVTVPFKLEAFALCDIKSANAFMAGAVNTLLFADGKIYGHNTDGDGLIADITENLGVSLTGKRVLLLGAGGAAEGVFQPILNQNPVILTIANRSLEKAQKIVNKFISNERVCHACTFEDLSHQAFDIIINATSAGLTDTALPIPDSIFAKGSLAYDMMYGRETPFIKQANANGATVADGLGMLIEQAALAFKVWRKVKPHTSPVIQQFRQS
jgi:shikimate dehydrogenase